MILYAILLGAVAGVTAFLPVSSTGHVVFLAEALHFKGPPGKLFEISLQWGTVFALCWFYRERLGYTLAHLRERPQHRFVLNILIACLPVCFFGWMLNSLITESLFHIWVVGITLFSGGIAILGVERWKPPTATATLHAITPLQAFVIGLFQSLALLPGVSRLAASLLGGLLLGIERQAATEFSLFLAIPTLSAAALFELCANHSTLTASALALTVTGCAVALLCSVCVVGVCVRYISRHSLQPFGWYRVLVGGAIVAGLMLAH